MGLQTQELSVETREMATKEINIFYFPREWLFHYCTGWW
jgi:hypothetical protein